MASEAEMTLEIISLRLRIEELEAALKKRRKVKRVWPTNED